MKINEAMKIINYDPNHGFMVSFEKIEGPFLRSDHFPDKHAGEELIPTEQEAWNLAAQFARKMSGQVVNVYVVNADFQPVRDYRNKMYLKR